MILFRKSNYVRTTVFCPKCGKPSTAYQPYYGYMDLSAIHSCATNKKEEDVVIVALENSNKRLSGGGDLG